MLLLKTNLKASFKNSDFGLAGVKKRRPEPQDDFCRERPAEKKNNEFTSRGWNRISFGRIPGTAIGEKKHQP